MSAPLRGDLRVGGDKAISHRAALLAALAPGPSRIRGFSPAHDCAATLTGLRALGVTVRPDGDSLLIEGQGPEGLRAPAEPLDCGRSGTTMRLLAGAIAGAGLEATLTGDEQLLARPMRRVAEPLRSMGADVALARGDRAPLRVRGGRLHGIDHAPEVASAQVKSAVLLAGVQADGVTRVRERIPTRDHTERLLAAMDADITREREGAAAAVAVRRSTLRALDLDVPGDISSAAALVAAAALVPGSDVTIRDVGLNPLRTGFLAVLRRMGADLTTAVRRSEPEPAGALRVRHAVLRATAVDAAEVPSLVDELPLLAAVATQAEGETVVRGAAELRVKESDRLAGVVAGLRALGADAAELDDGFAIRGPTPLHGGTCDPLGDHRLTMTFAVAGLIADGPVILTGPDRVADSFPAFGALLAGAARA